MRMSITLILIASMLLAGCSKDINNIVDESVSDTPSDSVIVPEITIPESSVTENSEVITNEKPQFEHDWQSLYYDELTKYTESPMVMFNIYDIDEDGIPELLLSEGAYHFASGTLYTVYLDKLVYLGEYGGYGEFQYDPERKYIHSSFFHMGSGHLAVFSIENGEATAVCFFSMYNGSLPSMPEVKYKINDEDVPEDVFNAEYEKYSFDIREDFIVRKYDTTQSTIESVLKQH